MSDERANKRRRVQSQPVSPEQEILGPDIENGTISSQYEFGGNVSPDLFETLAAFVGEDDREVRDVGDVAGVHEERIARPVDPGAIQPVAAGNGRSKRARNFVFTAHLLDNTGVNPVGNVYTHFWRNPLWESLLVALRIRYICFQLEVAPNTGREHLQGYVQFDGAVEYNTATNRVIQALLREDGYKTAHPYTNPAAGRPDQCRAYCCKDGGVVGSFVEYGTIVSGSGARTDIERAREHIEAGNDFASCMKEHTDVCVKYVRGMQLLYSCLKSTPRCPKNDTTVRWWCGPTGTGKSRLAFERYPDYYVKPNGKWWDFYDGQIGVIMDDWRPSSLPVETYLRIWDRYPLLVEVKGQYVHLQATNFVITTPFLPDDPRLWTSEEEDVQQVVRRCTEIIKFNAEGQQTVLKDINTPYIGYNVLMNVIH